MPFKRELSMEAYLVENEDVLALDDDDFSDINIIQEELTLKDGRPSKDTDGRIDILITYSAEYIGVVELKLGELEERHLTQLEDYLSKKEQILQQYPDILDSNLKWIGILVGTSINAQLADKISKGYKTDSNALIAALIVERFKGEDGSIYVTTDTYFKKSTSSRDTTKYTYNGKSLNKGKLVLAVIKQHVQNKEKISFSELEQDFPQRTQGSKGVFSTLEKANEIRLRERRRHFLKPEEIIKLSDSTIAVNRNWDVDNIERFIEKAKIHGHKIDREVE
ncbi:MAG: hypothetical protein V6Z81_08530 [Parvularculales bacterium]